MAAIASIPAMVWADAADADGGHRDGAALAEISGVLPPRVLADYPTATRVIVRRDRPHPGAQLDVFEERRYTAFATDTPAGQLDARHRAHARVEDRIRCGKDTGLEHFPSPTFQVNATRLAVVMLATDLTAWTQHLVHDSDLAKAEPRTLRYRLLHVAARLSRGQRVLPVIAAHLSSPECVRTPSGWGILSSHLRASSGFLSARVAGISGINLSCLVHLCPIADSKPLRELGQKLIRLGK